MTEISTTGQQETLSGMTLQQSQPKMAISLLQSISKKFTTSTSAPVCFNHGTKCVSSTLSTLRPLFLCRAITTWEGFGPVFGWWVISEDLDTEPRRMERGLTRMIHAITGRWRIRPIHRVLGQRELWHLGQTMVPFLSKFSWFIYIPRLTKFGKY